MSGRVPPIHAVDSLLTCSSGAIPAAADVAAGTFFVTSANESATRNLMALDSTRNAVRSGSERPRGGRQRRGPRR